jgi:hypothetical protein
MTQTSTPTPVRGAAASEAAVTRTASVQQALERNGQAMDLLVAAARSLATAVGHARLHWAVGHR